MCETRTILAQLRPWEKAAERRTKLEFNMDINELFGRPDHFLLAFEPQHAVFADMDRDAYLQSIFCDMRIAAKSKQMLKAPLAPLCDYRDRVAGQTPSINYIFHVAHCGSTLLARALDLKDRNIIYREPMALRQLAVERYAAGFNDERAWKRKLDLTTTLLNRRYEKDGPAIVKANVPVNFIVPELLARSPNQPTIVIYFPLEHYLMAILRSPNHRKWVVSVVNEMQRAIAQDAPLESQMSVAKAAASLWLAQVSIYHAAISKYPNVASLNAEDLFETPEIVVRSAFAHFGQAVDDQEIASIVGGELFARYSKNPQVVFDNAARLQRREALRRSLQPELDEAQQWVARAAAKTTLPARLANPLVREGAELLMRA